MRFRATALVAALAAATLAPPALAAVEEYTIDPVHSSVGFQVRHLFSKVPGHFNKFTGSFSYDPADLSTAKIRAEIDPATVDTNAEKRDNHLKSADFFDVAKCPTLIFESTAVRGNGKDEAVVTGNLTMHCVTKPVELHVKRLGSMADPKGGTVAGFEARGTLNRKDFDVSYGLLDTANPMVGNEVELLINVEARQAKPATAGEAKAGDAKAGEAKVPAPTTPAPVKR